MLTHFRTYQLALKLYEACEPIPCPRHLRDQLLRASLSIVLNTAEGSAKPSPKEQRRFYGIALASTRETQALLQILKRTEEFKIADQVGACLYRLTHGAKRWVFSVPAVSSPLSAISLPADWLPEDGLPACPIARKKGLPRPMRQPLFKLQDYKPGSVFTGQSRWRRSFL
jgi:four helix bundle protein